MAVKLWLYCVLHSVQVVLTGILNVLVFLVPRTVLFSNIKTHFVFRFLYYLLCKPYTQIFITVRIFIIINGPPWQLRW